MMAKSHVLVGLASWVVVAPMLHLAPLSPLELGLAVAGSLLPDIDHPGSWVGRRLRPVSGAIAGVFGHRGITHSAVAVVGLVLLLRHGGYTRPVTAALAVGYLSHLAADMLTPRGLRLAWPLRMSWGVPICHTGSGMEAGVVTGVCLLAGLCVIGDFSLPAHLAHLVRHFL